MLKWTLVLFSLLLPTLSSAQNMWGSGVYGGMQNCGYPTQAGNGATSVDDGTKEILSEIAEAQKQLRTKKSEKKKIERDAERSKEDIAKSISDDYESFILEHIENSRRCQEYKGYKSAQQEEASASGQEGDAAIPDGNMTPISAFSASEWSQYCDQSKAGGVSVSVCTNPKFKELGDERTDAQSCKKGLTEYRKQYAKSQKIQREIEGLESKISRAKESLADAKKDAAEERKNAQTEGGICLECMQQGNNSQPQQQQQQTNWGNVIANVGTGLFASYMGYQQNKMISENNANLGWPTQSYPALSYGYPYLAAGIYGAVSGGTGQGAFGCTNGINGTGNMNGPMGMMGAYGMGSPYNSMGGAFGYPNGMMGNMMGGGMYNSGMGPWGMNGMTNNPMMTGNMGLGSMMGTGAMMSGYGNMMGMGTMMGGYGNMMGMGTMMSGYGNMMGTGSMMGMDSSSMMYQQQMMQMQMQQYQSYMQKYQTVSSLQQEMYSLMNRIQQVQYGGSSYIGGSLGTTTSGYYNPSVLTPISTTGTTGILTPVSTGVNYGR